MLSTEIIDADICVKLGQSEKYPFLLEVIPLLADQVYMHVYTCNEVKFPSSAVNQLRKLIGDGKVSFVSETELSKEERAVFDMTFNQLGKVMFDPSRPNKNRGEAYALAYAKVRRIPVFATDEMDLQPMIDKQLNIGKDDIRCLRIVDIVLMARDGEIALSRKSARTLWVIAGKKKEIFDSEIWQLASE